MGSGISVISDPLYTPLEESNLPSSIPPLSSTSFEFNSHLPPTYEQYAYNSYPNQSSYDPATITQSTTTIKKGENSIKDKGKHIPFPYPSLHLQPSTYQKLRKSILIRAYNARPNDGISIQEQFAKYCHVNAENGRTYITLDGIKEAINIIDDDKTIKQKKHSWLSTLLSATGLNSIKELDFDAFLLFLEEGICSPTDPIFQVKINSKSKNENQNFTNMTQNNNNNVDGGGEWNGEENVNHSSPLHIKTKSSKKKNKTTTNVTGDQENVLPPESNINYSKKENTTTKKKRKAKDNKHMSEKEKGSTQKNGKIKENNKKFEIKEKTRLKVRLSTKTERQESDNENVIEKNDENNDTRPDLKLTEANEKLLVEEKETSAKAPSIPNSLVCHKGTALSFTAAEMQKRRLTPHPEHPLWRKREYMCQERVIEYTTIDVDGTVQELIEKESSKTEILHMECKETGEFAHRETTIFEQKETFNDDVVVDEGGVEEYVHLKSTEDEYEFLDSTMPPRKETAGGPSAAEEGNKETEEEAKERFRKGDLDPGRSRSSPYPSPSAKEETEDNKGHTYASEEEFYAAFWAAQQDQDHPKFNEEELVDRKQKEGDTEEVLPRSQLTDEEIKEILNSQEMKDAILKEEELLQEEKDAVNMEDEQQKEYFHSKYMQDINMDPNQYDPKMKQDIAHQDIDGDANEFAEFNKMRREELSKEEKMRLFMQIQLEEEARAKQYTTATNSDENNAEFRDTNHEKNHARDEEEEARLYEFLYLQDLERRRKKYEMENGKEQDFSHEIDLDNKEKGLPFEMDGKIKVHRRVKTIKKVKKEKEYDINDIDGDTDEEDFEEIEMEESVDLTVDPNIIKDQDYEVHLHQKEGRYIGKEGDKSNNTIQSDTYDLPPSIEQMEAVKCADD